MVEKATVKNSPGRQDYQQAWREKANSLRKPLLGTVCVLAFFAALTGIPVGLGTLITMTTQVPEIAFFALKSKGDKNIDLAGLWVIGAIPILVLLAVVAVALYLFEDINERAKQIARERQKPAPINADLPDKIT